MSQPTIYVDLGFAKPVSPLSAAIIQVASAFGACPVDKIRSSDGVEVNIVVTDSLAKAEQMIKSTTNAVIVYAYLSVVGSSEAERFAARHPDRVHSVHFFGLGQHEARTLVILLKQLIDARLQISASS
ncbi:TPA: hypothetical protein DF272_00160 [Candidatus Falkowbacteria bacterium]|nr:hypothetical protein [Candidatus Falkowbacteria bacterium]